MGILTQSSDIYLLQETPKDIGKKLSAQVADLYYLVRGGGQTGECILLKKNRFHLKKVNILQIGFKNQIYGSKDNALVVCPVDRINKKICCFISTRIRGGWPRETGEDQSRQLHDWLINEQEPKRRLIIAGGGWNGVARERRIGRYLAFKYQIVTSPTKVDHLLIKRGVAMESGDDYSFETDYPPSIVNVILNN